MYCGNNANDPKLLGGREVLGTRYGCLRKGIGVGRNLPYNQINYVNPFVPIDNRNPYCGINQVLPVGYDHFGKLRECFETGVGVGMAQRAGQGYIFLKSNEFYNLLFLFIFGIIFTLCYVYKPSFVCKTDCEGKATSEIDWKIFGPCIGLLVLLFLFCRFYFFL